MLYPSKLTNYFLYGTVIWCLFSFKTVFFGVGDGGVRLDDFLIFGAFFIMLARGDIVRRPISKPVRYYLLFSCVGIFSGCWNGIVGRVHPFTSVVWAIRLLEYLTFYYIGFYVAERKMNLGRVLSAYIWAMIIVVPLQMMGIVPIVSSFSRERAVGNTNGPYELAAVASFTLCYLGYGEGKKLAGGISGILIFLTASRVTTVAAVLSFFKVRIQRANSRKGIVVAVLSLVTIVLLYLSLSTLAKETNMSGLGVFKRLENSESITSWSEVEGLWNDAPYFETADDYATEGFFGDEDLQIYGGDESSFQRYRHWIILIKNTVRSPDSIVLGLGPSFGTIAVDGYYIRVFIETGLLGIITFGMSIGYLFFERRRTSWAFREFVLIMILTGSLIDIFASYHPMILLWLWHGMNQVQHKSKASIRPPRESFDHESPTLPEAAA